MFDIGLRRNPYLQPLPFQISRVTTQEAHAILPEVLPELCAGHFPLYPAMPIAMLMQGLSTLCGEVLCARLGRQTRYVLTDATVRADQLAFAGQQLAFEAQWQGQAQYGHAFRARAHMRDGTLVGEADFVLELVTPVAQTIPAATPARCLSRA